jgi:hypothetical protein
MAERKRDDKDEREAGERGDLRPIVGTPGATPPLSSQQSITTTPVTVTGEQAGGTILLDTGQVVYTREGAVSAVPGGPPDPTIIPGQYEDAGEPPAARGARGAPGAPGAPGVRVVDRGDAGPLTGDK